MTCGICIDIIHECVTLMPCLHNFCGGCFSEWMTKSHLCPKCRDPVNEARKNTTLNNIIEAYIKANPEAERDEEDRKKLTEQNKITTDVFKVEKVSTGNSSGSEIDSDASASDSGEDSEEEKKATRPVRRRAVATRRPARSAIPANMPGSSAPPGTVTCR